MPKWRDWRLLSIVLPLVVLLFWEWAARQGLLPPSYSVAPSAIFANVFDLIFFGELSNHLKISLIRIFKAITLATVLGVGTAMVLTQSSLLDRIVSPSLRFIAPIPVVAWMPVVVLIFGIDEAYKIILASLAGFLIIQSHTYEGVRAIERDFIEVADLYGAKGWSRVKNFLLPAATPSIFVGIRLALAIAWIVLFFVEFSSATKGSEGLGWFIANAREIGRVEDEYAGVVVLGAAGFTTDYIVERIQLFLTRWADTVADESDMSQG